MLSLTRNSVLHPATVHRLPLAPGISEFHYYVEEAVKQKGIPVDVTWTTPSKATSFELRIWQENNINWQLSCKNKHDKKMLWRQEGSDVLLMYNLVVTACAELGEASMVDDSFDTSGMFRDIEQGAYYARPSLLDYSDSKKDEAPVKATSWLRTTAPQSGDLAQTSAATILQAFSSALMTGKLSICGGTASGTEVYFNRGEIVHAQQHYCSGFDVICNLLLALRGTYEFHAGATTMEFTIFCDVGTLISQANKLRERLSELEKSGWNEKSIIIKHKYKTVSCDRIDRCLRQADSNLELHRNFYRAIDEKSTAKDIAKRLGMSSSQWIPVLAHLLASNLIAFASAPIPQLFILAETAEPRKPVETVEQQRGMIDSLCRLMKSTVTGIFTYPALLFFMDQEVQRCRRMHTSMSLIVFEVSVVREAGQKQPLPLEAVKEMVTRINNIKRGTDTFSHFEDASEYALLLPETTAAGAKVFARKLLSALLEAPLMRGVDCRNLDIAYGIGSVADKVSSVETLTSAATSSTIEDRPLPLAPAFTA